MTDMMRAAVLRAPGPVENLDVRQIPVPVPPPGWVRIRVRAAGVNRSDLHLRLGYAEGVRTPIVPGIEAVGVVDAAPDSDLETGTQVAAVLGGMGRAYNGGYADYVVVPRGAVIPFRSRLSWPALAAIPETLQTAYGSLSIGLDLKPGQTLLIRGGTSALGFAAIALAKDLGAKVLATTRQAERLDLLAAHGADHPILDAGTVADQVRAIVPSGVDTALELVGTSTLPDSLAATAIHGTVCFTGMLSNQWTIPDFYPIAYLPRGVRLTAYSGGPGDLPSPVLQRFLDRIEHGDLDLGPITTYPLGEVRQAHADIENNTVTGKVVLTMDPREGIES